MCLKEDRELIRLTYFVLCRWEKNSKRDSMPRRARLDIPGTLHHVMVRGIERRRIVDDVADRPSPAAIGIDGVAHC